MSAFSYLILKSTDAARNLATEQVIFDTLPRGHNCFLLWQNRSAVVIGRHQDALAEIDRAFVETKGIQLVRRLSGGGAVYHDLGNLNYSVITDARGSKAPDMAMFCEPVLRLLHRLGVPAALSGRNDMTVNGQKFSGSAQHLYRGRVLHHGTLLIDSDLSVVSRALRVDPEKIRSKGLSSVRSRVTNLRPFLPEEIDLPRFRELLLEEVLKEHPGGELTLSPEQLEEIGRLSENRYRSWDWTVGASPPCSLVRRQRFEGCGTVEARLQIEHGRIAAISFCGDFFSMEEPEELEGRLRGHPLNREALLHALEGSDVSHFFIGLKTEQFLSLLCS